MTEPPVHVEPDGVMPHPHHVGQRWIDLTLAASAIFISTASLFIASQHAKTQEQLVAATSWPFLQFRTSNNDAQGKPVISMAVINSGQGPALLKSVIVTYDGVPVTGAYDLLARCCGFKPLTPEEAGRHKTTISTTLLSGVVIPPHQEHEFFHYERISDHDPMWERMNDVRFKLRFDACYCSILGECWRSDLHGLEPKKVKQCPSTGGYLE